ncbi:hypothetical protein TL16_g07759 [Triparma laevis f. inornata]|uniref:Uncharacterized protein n=1 Tax=Triparma laevis f. inornata TaxID=1714386 RepID=A0A9W7AUX6_9STRA|nr:hypothetical protein TL16_g07759 [Triparma laevis f. inornata]
MDNSPKPKRRRGRRDESTTTPPKSSSSPSSAPKENSPSAPKSGRKRDLPKKGDEGYLSPTQLRNRRKRKKQKRDKDDDAGAGGDGEGEKSEEVKVKKKKKKKPTKGPGNPDQKYIRQPLKCPIVLSAQSHFSSTTPPTPYPITLGPLTRWRNISKLPCRSINGSIKFGLFQPGTHSMNAKSSQSPAHHPKINEAILFMEKGCGECEVKAYEEKDGEGELKFVIFNIDRKEEKVR